MAFLRWQGPPEGLNNWASRGSPDMSRNWKFLRLPSYVKQFQAWKAWTKWSRVWLSNSCTTWRIMTSSVGSVVASSSRHPHQSGSAPAAPSTRPGSVKTLLCIQELYTMCSCQKNETKNFCNCQKPKQKNLYSCKKTIKNLYSFKKIETKTLLVIMQKNPSLSFVTQKENCSKTLLLLQFCWFSKQKSLNWISFIKYLL